MNNDSLIFWLSDLLKNYEHVEQTLVVIKYYGINIEDLKFGGEQLLDDMGIIYGHSFKILKALEKINLPEHHCSDNQYHDD